MSKYLKLCIAFRSKLYFSSFECTSSPLHTFILKERREEPRAISTAWFIQTSKVYHACKCVSMHACASERGKERDLAIWGALGRKPVHKNS